MHHFHARELPPLDVARREFADAARKLRPFQITNAHDVSRLELGEDVEGRRLGLQPQVPGDHHGRAELAQRMGEGQEGCQEGLCVGLRQS